MAPRNDWYAGVNVRHLAYVVVGLLIWNFLMTWAIFALLDKVF